MQVAPPGLRPGRPSHLEPPLRCSPLTGALTLSILCPGSNLHHLTGVSDPAPPHRWLLLSVTSPGSDLHHLTGVSDPAPPHGWLLLSVTSRPLRPLSLLSSEPLGPRARARTSPGPGPSSCPGTGVFFSVFPAHLFELHLPGRGGRVCSKALRVTWCRWPEPVELLLSSFQNSK